MPISAPRARKGCHPLVEPIVPELDQVLMHQFDAAQLFARLSRLWTCRVFVPLLQLIYAAFRSKAKGLFQSSAECFLRAL